MVAHKEVVKEIMGRISNKTSNRLTNKDPCVVEGQFRGRGSPRGGCGNFQRNDVENDNRITCWRCGRPSHIERNCWSRGNNQKAT